MKKEKPPYSIAAKYYDELIPKNRGQSIRDLHSFLHGLWDFSDVLPRCLDVGCGTGGIFRHWDCSHLDPLSHGIDPSSEMIALARSNCPQIYFEEVDLLEFNSINKFDWIVSTGNAVNYIAPDERRKFFEKAADLLAPTGLLYFDFDTRRDIEEFWPGQIRIEKRSSFRFEAEYTYDIKRDVGVEKQYWSETKNKKDIFYETHHIYPISPAEIVRDLKETKFKDPIFCHPEDYKFVSDGADFLVLGCIVRLFNG